MQTSAKRKLTWSSENCQTTMHHAGPDGFNGLFIKRCWHTIRDDFTRLFTSVLIMLTSEASIHLSLHWSQRRTTQKKWMILGPFHYWTITCNASQSYFQQDCSQWFFNWFTPTSITSLKVEQFMIVWPGLFSSCTCVISQRKRLSLSSLILKKPLTKWNTKSFFKS
jgi:hypothetical protein